MALKPVAKVSWTKEPRCPVGWTVEEWNEELVRRGWSKHGVAGLVPQGLFTIRVYDAKMRKSWHQAQRHTGVIVVESLPIGDDDGRPCKVVVRVVGSADQLDALLAYPCVEMAQHVVSARVPMGEKCDEGGVPYVLKVTAQGAGPEKVRPAPKRHMEVSVESMAEYKANICREAPEGKWTAKVVDPMPKSGHSTNYPDTRHKQPKPTGSNTEYESLDEARKASTHTDIPTTVV